MTETPKYTILQSSAGIEIREYSGYIQAEVSVAAADYKSAAGLGFNILAGYIFGNNVSRQQIEMTIPVTAARSEKIAMTTPVTIRGGDTYTVAFIMPASYTLETLPVPRDSRVRFRQVPPHRAAAIRFPGYFSPERIRQGKERLNRWIAENRVESDGETIIAGYNPPWVPGFLARNEVLVRIQA